MTTIRQPLVMMVQAIRRRNERIRIVPDVIGEVNPKARNYKPADFVDLSLLQELEKEGFLKKFSGS